MKRSFFSIKNCHCLAVATFVCDCSCNPLVPLSYIRGLSGNNWGIQLKNFPDPNFDQNGKNFQKQV